MKLRAPALLYEDFQHWGGGLKQLRAKGADKALALGVHGVQVAVAYHRFLAPGARSLSKIPIRYATASGLAPWWGLQGGSTPLTLIYPTHFEEVQRQSGVKSHL